MAAFTTDDDGEVVFPPEHPLTMDTSERNQGLVEEDGKIWDSGFLVFEDDMKSEEPIVELLEVTIDSLNTTVRVLQLMAEYVTMRGEEDTIFLLSLADNFFLLLACLFDCE